MQTIDAQKWDTDDYGVPVLALEDVKEAQVELGLGPLHTHSVFSDGHVWPRIRVAEAIRDGLDAMARNNFV